MDWDLWIKIARRFPVRYQPVTLARFRIYPQAKSPSGGLNRLYEIREMLLSHGSRAPRLFYKIGLWHYQRNQMREARRHFREALRRGPVPPLRRTLIALYLKSLLGGRLVDVGRAIFKRLGLRG
jgi:hypothetical protein